MNNEKRIVNKKQILRIRFSTIKQVNKVSKDKHTEV